MRLFPRLVSRTVVLVAAVGGCALAPLATNAQANRPEVPPGLELGGNSRGKDALARLGKELPDVAAAYDMTGPQLAALIRSQHDLWVDRSGRLLYICEGLKVADASGSGSAVESSSAIPNSADAFKLHSLPGSSRVIYLDFTGHTTSGTSWNSSFTGGTSIVSAPFDFDGDPSSFSTTERDRIKKIWQRVAEDYVPFAVDVTTEDPGTDALIKSGSTDQAYGVRVVISPTSAWYPNAGGVAYIGSFSWGSDTPCFVFSNMLGPNGEKYVAEACSHEVGHTLGLNHDGKTDGTSYYSGQGNWAPIMGVGYYKPIVQWSKGEYAMANNTQDDLAIIPTYGAPIAADDHGNTLATATTIYGPSITALGVIETRSDADVFRFDTGAGTVSFSVNGTSPEPNLDARLDLLNSSGSVIATSDPSGLGASISKSLAAGTYYLRVDGVGYGDPVTTGYSDYASLGEYALTGTIVSNGLVPPVAIATSNVSSGTAPLVVQFSSAGSSDSDGSIASYRWDFGNGQTSTAQNPSVTYSNPGVYTATLTVTDNDNLNDSDSVVITVADSPNVRPVASASGSPASGTVPLNVSFSSGGSYDPNGSIVSYSWNFGDGSSSSAANPSHTYNSIGSFSAVLTVVDNDGASASSSVTISASENQNRDIDVSQFDLGIDSAKSGKAAVATIRVLDRLGKPVAGAGISVSWSGVISGSSSGTTDSNGYLTLTSRRSKRGGNFTGTITAITSPAGYQLDESLFSEPLTQTIAATGR